MAQTFAELIQRVIASVGEVEGTSVQTYSEPRVREALKQVFNIIVRKYWWPQYMAWYDLDLDGTLGIVTSATFGETVKEFRDIRAIYPDFRDNRALPQLPANLNPFSLSGDKVRYYQPLPASSEYFATRVLQFWPKSAEGSVVIHAREVPAVEDDLTNQLDDQLMIFGATWLILEAEDINPNAAGLAERMFNEAYTDIIKQLGEQPIENPISYLREDYLSTWS